MEKQDRRRSETAASGTPDAEMVRRVLAGDREAYAELVTRYLPMVKAFLSGRGVSDADIDDAAQSAMVVAYEQLSRLRQPERIASYMLTVAARQVARLGPATVDVCDIPDPPAPEASASMAGDSLEAAVARLPQHMQVALNLKYQQGLSAAEIAERLGQSVGSVTKSLSRAYDRLRRDRELIDSIHNE